LIKGEANPAIVTSDLPNLSNQGLAEREKDVAVLMGVLEHRVAPVVVQAPAGGLKNLPVAVQRVVGGDEIEHGEGRGILDF